MAGAFRSISWPTPKISHPFRLRPSMATYCRGRSITMARNHRRRSDGYVADIEVSLGAAAWITTGAQCAIRRQRRWSRSRRPSLPTSTWSSIRNTSSHPVRTSGIREFGVDLAQGSVVLQRGSLVGAAEMGLLASLGSIRWRSCGDPESSVLSTGNEWSSQTRGPARDSPRREPFSLIAALQEAGADVALGGRGPDDAVALRSSLMTASPRVTSSSQAAACRWATSILSSRCSGGAAEVHFRRVFMKPGKPLDFATSGDHLDIQSAW